MKKKRGLKVLTILVIILAVIFTSALFVLKTSKGVDVKWAEEDYTSYAKKIGRTTPQTGEFNLINISKDKIVTKGKRDINVSFSNAEISSVLSKENSELGPVKDVKVKFTGSNEAETTFKLTDNFSNYIDVEKYALVNNSLAKAALNGTPVYMRVKVDKASGKSIAADIKEVNIGRIPLSSGVVQKIETEAVSMVNKILAKYDTLNIDSLSFDEGKMNFKGSIPEEIKLQK